MLNVQFWDGDELPALIETDNLSRLHDKMYFLFFAKKKAKQLNR